MSISNAALRPWRVVARELAHEHNVDRILQLSDELNEAFGAQDLGLTEQKAPGRSWILQTTKGFAI